MSVYHIIVCWLGCVAAAVDTSPVYVYDATGVLTASPAAAYEEPHLLAAVSGLANRDSSQFYYLWGPADAPWLSTLHGPNQWLAGRTIQNLTTIESVVSRFNQYFHGVVLYDPNVPQTSVVASTVAGVSSLLPVCYRLGDNTSLYHRLVESGPRIPVVVSLVGKFNGHTGSAKNEAILWAKENYLDKGYTSGVLGYYIDYYWVTQATKTAGPYLKNTVGNHDYFISKKAFFFDLSPWADEAPNDDPNQPLGRDYESLKAVLLSSYQTTNGSTMHHVGGFPPWPFKYVKPWGKHEGVATEWEFAKVVSAYNGYMDGDACCYAHMANAAFFTHFPLPAQFPQNPAPTVDTLRSLGYVDANGHVIPKSYFMFYVGDYDSAAWLYNVMRRNWDDPKRGHVPLGWAVDPNLKHRFPVIYHHMLTSLAPSDRIISGDSGAGYVNPTQLLPPRKVSGLPDASHTWIAHNQPLYHQFSVNFTGFLINGDLGVTTRAAEQMYVYFSKGGIVSDGGSNHMTDGMPVLVHNLDLPGGDPIKAAAAILQNAAHDGPLAFHVYRTILQTATFHYDVVQQLKAKNPKLVPVDPLVLGLLQTLSMEQGLL